MEWPNWRGRAVAIVASGPSLKKADVAALQGRLPVVAIKRNVELAPWADAVYGCDFPWWRSVHGLIDYRGLKLAYEQRACDRYGCAKVRVSIDADELLFGETGSVGSGGNSGFHAFNLVLQLGAPRILLLGFDVHDRGGAHWYGRNNALGMSNPGDDNFKRWRRAFATAAGQLEGQGYDVVNASPTSDLKGFPKAAAAETLARWGL